MSNKSLRKAKQAKDDEFYTRYEDIEKELCHYTEHFRDKVVYCNCDNPEWSAFWQYFHENFAALGLRQLVATFYDPAAPVYKMVYEGGNDADVSAGIKTPLAGNGDFRSAECMELLDESDMVVTNPPWSMFREFVLLLMEHQKKFIIIGNKNSITYKEFFPLLKDNRIYIGYTVPSDFVTPFGTTKDVDRLGRWFTNLDIQKRHEELVLQQRYYDDNGNPLPDAEARYPYYDNFDAIDIGKEKAGGVRKGNTNLIPTDYQGPMGVPITFFDKYCPEQFEIIGLFNGYTPDTADPSFAIYGTAVKVPSVKSLYRGPVVNGKAAYARIIVKYRQSYIDAHPELFKRKRKTEKCV